jgi:hypothetical protein
MRVYFIEQKNIRHIWKKSYSEEVAQQYVSSAWRHIKSEQLANYVYAKTDGNSEPGDGTNIVDEVLFNIQEKII